MQAITSQSGSISSILRMFSNPSPDKRKVEIGIRIIALAAASVAMASLLSAIPANASEGYDDTVIDPAARLADPERSFPAPGFLVEAGGKHHWWGHDDDAEGKEGRSGRLAKRVKRTTHKMLRRIDATPEQRERVDEIVTRSMDDILGLRSEFQKSRRAMLAVLVQEAPDQAALEDIRDDMLRLDSEINARILDGVIEVSEVLTPDQRRKIVSRYSGKRGGFFGRLHRRWHDRFHHYDDDDHHHDMDRDQLFQ